MDATRFEQHLIELTGALSARRDGFAEPVVVMHQRILRHFASTGEPPTAETVRAWSGELEVDPLEALEQLVKADLVEADPAAVRVVGAYPFVGESRGHEVHIADGRRVHTYCAVDALGVPAMLGRPVAISSRDPHTGDEVSITIDDGDASWAPQGAVASVPADAVDRTVAPAEEIEQRTRRRHRLPHGELLPRRRHRRILRSRARPQAGDSHHRPSHPCRQRRLR